MVKITNFQYLCNMYQVNVVSYHLIDVVYQYQLKMNNQGTK